MPGERSSLPQLIEANSFEEEEGKSIFGCHAGILTGIAPFTRGRKAKSVQLSVQVAEKSI
jgi:hypothetical protein